MKVKWFLEENPHRLPGGWLSQRPLWGRGGPPDRGARWTEVGRSPFNACFPRWCSPVPDVLEALRFRQGEPLCKVHTDTLQSRNIKILTDPPVSENIKTRNVLLGWEEEEIQVQADKVKDVEGLFSL